jgi:prolyl-tRNA editing enzyme YbaK/EbsC (Cys-tRNA(Pro) deacylase)
METRPLNSEDLDVFMQAQAIFGKILRLDVPTPTVEAAARAVRAEPESIVKSIVFLAAGRPVLAIATGQADIDRRAIAAVFGIGRKQVKLASAEEVLSITGYPVGGMPPFGHRHPLPTLIDRRVVEAGEIVYAGGGDDRSLLQINPVTILNATQAQLIDLVNPPKSASGPEGER